MKIRCYYSFIVIFAGIGAEGAPQIDNSILSDVAVDTTNPQSVLIAQMGDMQTGSTLVAYQLEISRKPCIHGATIRLQS